MLTANNIATELPISFKLTEEQELIKETIREMAQAEFAPRAAEIDPSNELLSHTRVRRIEAGR